MQAASEKEIADYFEHWWSVNVHQSVKPSLFSGKHTLHLRVLFAILYAIASMAVPEPFPQAELEDRLGNALGLAIYIIRHPEEINNRSMARLESQFKEWLDKVVDQIEAGTMDNPQFSNGSISSKSN